MRRIVAGGGSLALLLLCVALALPAATFGHALLSASDPAKNAVLSTAPTTITLTFTETPDPKLSRIRVFDSSGASCTSGAAEAVPGQPAVLRVALQPLADGTYTVAWQAVSSVDGHNATGSFAFSVGAPPASAPPGTTPAVGTVTGDSGGSSTPPSILVARWLLYLGLMGLLGAAFMGAVVAVEGPAPGVLRLLAGSWLVAAVASVAFGLAQIADTGVGLGDAVGSSLGGTLAARLVPIAIGALLLLPALRPGRWRRGALLAIGGCAAWAVGVDASVSHAAAGPWPIVNVGLQWLHFVVAGLWLGGIAALLLQIRGVPADIRARTARRFALFAGFGLAIVAVTGVARAAVEAGAIGSLFAGDYGRLLVVKVGVVAALAGLGAINHFRNVPAVGRSTRGLFRVGAMELAIAAFAFLTAAVIVNVPPPIEAASLSARPSAPAMPGASGMPSATSSGMPMDMPLVVSGSDYATTVKLQLAMTPGTLGPNTFSSSVVDYDSGAAVAATKVQLRFEMPDRPDIGASDLVLLPAADGSFAGSGTNLSIAGTWKVTALVERGAASVEVPLSVTVAAP